MDGQVAIPDVGVRRNRLPLARFNGRRRRLRHADREPLDDLADSPMAVVVGVQHPDRTVVFAVMAYHGLSFQLLLHFGNETEPNIDLRMQVRHIGEKAPLYN